MRVISLRKLREFWADHSAAESPLKWWAAVIEGQEFRHFADIRLTFPSADQVGHLTVFNIGGNKYRLVAAIHYNTQILFVRYVLTHQEYHTTRWQDG